MCSKVTSIFVCRMILTLKAELHVEDHGGLCRTVHLHWWKVVDFRWVKSAKSGKENRTLAKKKHTSTSF